MFKYIQLILGIIKLRDILTTNCGSNTYNSQLQNNLLQLQFQYHVGMNP